MMMVSIMMVVFFVMILMMAIMMIMKMNVIMMIIMSSSRFSRIINYFCSLDLSCRILEKDNFYQKCVYCLVLLNSVLL